MAEQPVYLNVACGPVRTTDDRPLRLRWKAGVLQYARHWSDGERQGHEWVDVPAVEPERDAKVQAPEPRSGAAGKPQGGM